VQVSNGRTGSYLLAVNVSIGAAGEVLTLR
jgi:hypothetical protein